MANEGNSQKCFMLCGHSKESIEIELVDGARMLVEIWGWVNKLYGRNDMTIMEHFIEFLMFDFRRLFKLLY